MSKSKEKKIKILKYKSIWPRVIAMIFSDLLVLIFTCFLSYLSVNALINSMLLENQSDCEKVIEVINRNWNENNRKSIPEKIAVLQNTFDSIEEVYVIDIKEKAILEQYGTKEKVEKLPGVNIYKMEWSFSQGELYRGSLSSNYEDGIDFEGRKTVEKFGNKFFKTLDFINFSINPRLLKWGNKVVDTEKQLVVYETRMPGICVGIENVYKVNNFQACFIGALVWIFIGVFLFCFITGIFRLVSYCIEIKKFETVIATNMITGGKNKDWFVDAAKRRIRNKKKQFAIVQVRLEKYRNYCTSFGVVQGENLLELLDKTLVRIVNKKECVAHVEKSDFVMLLEYENQEQLNDRLVSIVNQLKDSRKNQHLTFVTGVAQVKSRNDDINNLISASALALAKAEADGSTVVWFNDSMKEEQVWERRIEDDMENALLHEEFQVYLQPKYSTKGEELAAAEALVRWIHPVIGFISPGKFIPIFENNGFILKLDDYMLTSIAKLQANWMAQGRKLFPISVNISRAHFTKEDLAEHICGIVDEYKVPHEYIELELTESAFFDDKKILLDTVKKLKEYGFAISMDDFGAGYSSLNSLKEMPLDVIKLDAEFFRGIDDVNRANMIVENTIVLAKKLGMQIVAEGIETREQVDFLANQDCDLIQGFYFSKPLPVSEFEEKAYPTQKSE